MASFCASETAETGRIANGCEQGDHVSRRKGAKARVACCPDRGKLSACQKVPERERFLRSFCFCKKNQKAAARTCKKLPVASFCASETAETGRIANGCEQGDHVSRSRLRPATSVQNSIDYVFSCCFRLSSLNRYVVRRAFSDVLNRCERVIVVQTQDRCFSKMGCYTTSSQGQAVFEKGRCSLSLLR